MSSHEMSLKNIKKASIYKKSYQNFKFSTGTYLASKTQNKFKKVSVYHLAPILLVEKWLKKAKKQRQNEFSTRYRVQS